MGSLIDWEHLGREAQKDRRKGRRVPLVFAIEVHGFDGQNQLFRERTTTLDVSEDGCRFQVSIRLKRGDIVALRLLSGGKEQSGTNRPTLFQVAWCAPDGDKWAAGAFKLTAEDIWGVAFPPSQRPGLPAK